MAFPLFYRNIVQVFFSFVRYMQTKGIILPGVVSFNYEKRPFKTRVFNRIEDDVYVSETS